MFFWGVIWPMSGILFLIGLLKLVSHYRQRREKRLASGWHLAANEHPA